MATKTKLTPINKKHNPNIINGLREPSEFLRRAADEARWKADRAERANEPEPVLTDEQRKAAAEIIRKMVDDILAEEKAEKTAPKAPKPVVPYTGGDIDDPLYMAGKTFIDRYNQAVGAIAKADKKKLLTKTYGVIPLAPRLDVKLGKVQKSSVENVSKAKWGGYPELRNWYYIDQRHMSAPKGHPGEGRSNYENPGITLEQALKQYWPKCQCCGRPMTFLGQFDLNEWGQVLEYFTLENNPDSWNGKDNHNWFDHNASSSFPSLNYRRRILYFSCGCFSYGIFGADSAIIEAGWYGDDGMFKDIDLDFRGRPYTEPAEDASQNDKDQYRMHLRKKANVVTDAEYVKALKKALPKRCFQAEEQLVEDMTIGFDLDTVRHYAVYGATDMAVMPDNDITDDLEDFTESTEGNFLSTNNGYGTNADLCLFGAPRSQQTEKRVLDPRYTHNPHRLRPLICWNDRKYDQCHQMYGSLKEGVSELPYSQCKMDSSNT